jgi:hypothetical protein
MDILKQLIVNLGPGLVETLSSVTNHPVVMKFVLLKTKVLYF